MNKLKLEGVKILWPNLRGEETRYNPAGSRVFSVLIEDEQVALRAMDEGWNVKPLRNEDDEIDAYHIPVKVNYSSRRPPRIFIIRYDRDEHPVLTEDTVEMLDYANIEFADVYLNPYEWEVRGETGVKAYLDTMYVKIEENDLDEKWRDLEPSGCVMTEDMMVGKVYICNHRTGEFEEVTQSED